MYLEALNAYSLIVKNKQYAQSGRLRVNMGNIYYEQKKYSAAIKMYAAKQHNTAAAQQQPTQQCTAANTAAAATQQQQHNTANHPTHALSPSPAVHTHHRYRMALDQIPNTGREIRYKIMRNIGNAFVRLGQFQDAIASFEQIMDGSPDLQTGFNLALCHYASGDRNRMKKAFSSLLSVRELGMEDEEALESELDDVLNEDGLKEQLKKKQRQGNRYISVAAKLLAPVVEQDIVSGFNWVGDMLKAQSQQALATEIEIAKALYFMRSKEFDKAIEVLKSYEKKDQTLVAHAATNLSFIYFHESDYQNAVKYADIAMKHNRYAKTSRGFITQHKAKHTAISAHTRSLLPANTHRRSSIRATACLCAMSSSTRVRCTKRPWARRPTALRRSTISVSSTSAFRSTLGIGPVREALHDPSEQRGGHVADRRSLRPDLPDALRDQVVQVAQREGAHRPFGPRADW